MYLKCTYRGRGCIGSCRCTACFRKDPHVCFQKLQQTNWPGRWGRATPAPEAVPRIWTTKCYAKKIYYYIWLLGVRSVHIGSWASTDLLLQLPFQLRVYVYMPFWLLFNRCASLNNTDLFNATICSIQHRHFAPTWSNHSEHAYPVTASDVKRLSLASFSAFAESKMQCINSQLSPLLIIYCSAHPLSIWMHNSISNLDESAAPPLLAICNICCFWALLS